MLLDWRSLTLYIYILARVSGMILFNPLLGRSNIASIYRAGVVLVFTTFVASITTQRVAVPDTLLELGLHILFELSVGFALGMVFHFFFYIVQLAGHTVDTQMGMTMNQIYDQSAQANLSVTGLMLNILMSLLFFAANGHYTMLRIMLTSGDVVPFGRAFLTPQALNALLVLFSECTTLAMKLCMPILAAELLGQVGMGILMKVIPQINVFTINIELKVIVGFSLLFVLMAPFSEFLLRVESDMLSKTAEVLGLLQFS